MSNRKFIENLTFFRLSLFVDIPILKSKRTTSRDSLNQCGISHFRYFFECPHMRKEESSNVTTNGEPEMAMQARCELVTHNRCRSETSQQLQIHQT